MTAMVAPSGTSHDGVPTPPPAASAAPATFSVERFDALMRIPLIVSAILPLILVPAEGGWLALVVGILSWLVFVVDYVFHVRRVKGFARTGFGRFDLVVVVVTAPWYLLPGIHGGAFVVLIRLARLARILMVSRGSRKLFARLGRVGGVAIGVLVTASLVAYYAEHPTNPEFGSIGDALWWGIVTLTTVGYGDIVPKTATGRWAGVVIMVTGIAVLGVLAGSLAGFFRLDKDPDDPEQPPAESGDPALAALVSEVAALRAQLALLAERIADLGGGPAGADGPPGPGAGP